MNLNLSLIFFVCCVYFTLQYEDCCAYKSLGGHDYTLLKTDLALGISHYCKNGCIYYRDDTGPAGDHWCFSPGDEEPQCRAKPATTTTSAPVDGEWSVWGAWTSCDNGGRRQRRRSCDDPSPDHGGQLCPGDSSEVGDCSCDGGLNCCTQQRPCDLGEGDCDGDLECKVGLICGINNCRSSSTSSSSSSSSSSTSSSFEKETIDCCMLPPPPPPPATWSSWGSWSQICENGGRQVRTRSCRNGRDCQGQKDEYRDCTCVGGTNCCTSDRPCDEGQGDCDDDSDCKDELVCGRKHCFYNIYTTQFSNCCEVQGKHNE